MLYKEIYEQARPGSAFLEHLEAQGLEISANHGGRKGGVGTPRCNQSAQKNSEYVTELLLKPVG